MKFHSRVVQIGTISLGGDNPVRIQSMTNTDTMNTQATVEQSIRMIEAGCELVRITAPGIREAENLYKIKTELRRRGYTNPLIADIHFNPKAAEIAAQIVDKVRINPGNYVDRKKFTTRIPGDPENKAAVERIKERIAPLIELCKKHKTAMRIGVNHGSLSDRMVNRFGNTPTGMVESAMEFIGICGELDYHDLVLSMKSSNIKVMIQAYRQLVARMMEENRNYPLHLGVTEAGSGKEGRIKSAAGIGPLLMDGIGDTVRVSLTEAPEKEIPVARRLLEFCKPDLPNRQINEIHPFQFSRRKTREVFNIGGNQPVAVVSGEAAAKKDRITADAYLKNNNLHLCDSKQRLAVCSPNELPGADNNKLMMIRITDRDDFKDLTPHLQASKSILLLDHVSIIQQREIVSELLKHDIPVPVILKNDYTGMKEEEIIVKAAADFSALLVDGFGDGIWLESDLDRHANVETAFSILQATRARVTQTEYISCPTCGRTRFNIEETLKVVKKRTAHLKNLKIAVMGCIVNGPGEMADADYGYVGSGEGKVTLYKGQEIKKKNIPDSEAVDALIELIRENGDWKEQ